jgi:hypothetical protein
LRRLFAYQRQCLSGSENMLDAKTHELIAEATSRAHDVMQTCLHDVLIYEKWDLNTLEMPENLRQLLQQTLDE